MAPKGGGTRQRLGLVHRGVATRSDVAASSGVVARSDVDALVRRVGIRRRMGLVAERGSAEDPGNSLAAEVSAPARTGGSRKRLRLNEASSSASGVVQDVDLPLNRNMRKRFGSGDLSAVQVESIFRDAAAQGAQGTPQLSSPQYPQNLQRSLVAAFGSPAGAPEITWKMIPTTLGVIPHPFLLPDRFFSALKTSKPEFWAKTVCGPVGAARRFWDNMAGSAFMREHPHLGGMNLDWVIPLGMHGDSGKFSHYESLFVFTFNSLLGEGRTKSTRFLMTCIKKSLIAPGTIDRIAQILGHSFNVLLTGIDAAVDEEGAAIPSSGGYLAGGYKGCLVKVRVDWEF